jgi:hypothetical protein
MTVIEQNGLDGARPAAAEETSPASASASAPGPKLVLAARTVLIMLLVAAVAILGLGLAVQVLGDPPEVGGWLRAIFGRVFTVVAVGISAVLGIPALVGLWAMAGARAEGATPALSEPIRRGLAVLAIVAVIATAVVLVATGSAFGILNLGLFGIVALATLGLGGATSFSPHRGRAILAAIALVLVVLGTAWVLATAFLAR